MIPNTPNDPMAGVIVAPDGTPARKAPSQACPRCGAGTDKRIASSGFGTPHPLCSDCGYVWEDEVFRG